MPITAVESRDSFSAAGGQLANPYIQPCHVLGSNWLKKSSFFSSGRETEISAILVTFASAAPTACFNAAATYLQRTLSMS